MARTMKWRSSVASRRARAAACAARFLVALRIGDLVVQLAASARARTGSGRCATTPADSSRTRGADSRFRRTRDDPTMVRLRRCAASARAGFCETSGISDSTLHRRRDGHARRLERSSARRRPGARARRPACRAEPPGHAHDQRHVQRRVVEEDAVRVLAVVAERLAVIGGDDDDGVGRRRLNETADRADRPPRSRRRTATRRTAPSDRPGGSYGSCAIEEVHPEERGAFGRRLV